LELRVWSRLTDRLVNGRKSIVNPVICHPECSEGSIEMDAHRFSLINYAPNSVPFVVKHGDGKCEMDDVDKSNRIN
jgi:hypothetical protein